jgi:hypothetical protein
MDGNSYAQRVKEQPGRELLRTARVAGSLKRMDENPCAERTVESSYAERPLEQNG